MPAGFDFGTMRTSVFRVNTTGCVQRPFCHNCCGNAVFADAKTSAGAPSWICAARVFEPANEVARAQMCAVVSAQTLDLAGADDSLVVRVAGRLDPPLAVPTAQGVDADAERLRGFRRGVVRLRHQLVYRPSTSEACAIASA